MIAKSPLRYPGGKSRALKHILPLIPDFKEYREPMVGGGSVFLAVRQRFPNRKYWINDINYDLYCFWKTAQERTKELIKELHAIRRETTDGRALFNELLSQYEKEYKEDKREDKEDEEDEFSRAKRFFILNRIAFSGLVGSGGYSEEAFRMRFTRSSIERISNLRELLHGVRITHGDYEYVVKEQGENVFIFLDPPYYTTTASRLYGKNGMLHVAFDHHRLAEVLKDVSHRWLLTYDDCEEIRKLYSQYSILEWNLQYGMNNYKKPRALPGKELFIANYPLPEKIYPELIC